MAELIRAVAYARYSSDNQREESIDAQLMAIQRYAVENGFTIVNEYCDRAKTGTNDNREQFLQMINDAKNGLFDVLIVHKLDRFSRNRYLSAIYRYELDKCNVSLHSVIEKI
ncbi:MAG: recombinase family protein [Hungatella sp.]